MRRSVVIMYGPPGSGKGTQAYLIAEKFGIIHFDTGRLLESVVHDPANKKNKIIQRERKLFDAGILCTPSFVMSVIKRETAKLAKAGLGLIFSGSPRTLYEAQHFIPVLEKMYGAERIFFIVLDLPEKDSIARNTSRLVCSTCGRPFLSLYSEVKKPKHCPVCAGPLYKRTLDSLSVMRTRLQEYHTRTQPIFAWVKERGYSIRHIDARPSPSKVFSAIYDYLQKRQRD